MSVLLPLVFATTVLAPTAKTASSASAILSTTRQTEKESDTNTASIFDEDEPFVPEGNKCTNPANPADIYDNSYSVCNQNDVPYQATPLVDKTKGYFRGFNKYHSKIAFANLYKSTGPIDYDWYYFTLFCDSLVSLNVVSGDKDGNNKSSDYSLDLQELKYTSGENNNGKTLSILYEKSDSIDHSYLNTLSAGTYYICLANKGESTPIYYSLDLKVTGLDKPQSYDINDLRYNKGLKAALWSADYHPMGRNLAQRITKNDDGCLASIEDVEKTYQLGNFAYDPYRDFALDEIKETAGDTSIYTDMLYVWDMDVARALYSFFHALSSNIQVAQRNYDYLRTKYGCEQDKIEIVTKVVNYSIEVVFVGSSILFGQNSLPLLILGGFEYSSLDLVKDVVSTIGAALLSLFGNQAKESCDSGDSRYIDRFAGFVNGFLMALETKVGSNTDGSGNVEDTIAIPLDMYELEEDPGNLGSCSSQRIVFGRKAFSQREVYGGDKYALFYGGTIESFHKVDFNSQGKVYGFSDSVFSGKGLKSADLFGDIYHIPQELTTGTSKASIIHKGDYAWFSFTNRSGKEDSFCFFATSDEKPIDMTIFRKNELGYSSSNRLACGKCGKLLNDIDNGPDLNQSESQTSDSAKEEASGSITCYSVCDFPLESGEKIYVRVSGKDFSFANPTIVALRTQDAQTGTSDKNGLRYLANPAYETYGYSFSNEGSAGHDSFDWNGKHSVLENHHFLPEVYNSKTGRMEMQCQDCGYVCSYVKYTYAHTGAGQTM